MLTIAAYSLGAYFLGSISFGLLAARRRGVDLRAVGSGNTGATNVARALGKKTGRVVLLLDLVKGLVPVLAVSFLVRSSDREWSVAAVGLSAVLGHILPIWHQFRGGKGAATGLGVLLAAMPIAGLLAVAAFWVGRRWSSYTSVGSIVASLVGALTACIFNGFGPIGGLGVGVALLVIVSHRDNIRRLRNGTEPKA